jgi:GNAT superfamily N-acetyltransferase
MTSIRAAHPDDLDTLYGIDELAQSNDERRAHLARWVETETCYLAVTETNTIAGYGVFNYTFYENGFVAILYVSATMRQHGVGSTLMQHFETICRTPKLFTSTNLSNLPMQALLAKRNYALCGVIHQLDDNDPELVYFKSLIPSNEP